jgi:hypothetical protein
VRKTADAIDRRDSFQQESILLRDLEDADGHFTRYFASTSSNGSALISPRR